MILTFKSPLTQYDVRVSELKDHLGFVDPLLHLHGDKGTTIGLVDGSPQLSHPSISSSSIEIVRFTSGRFDHRADAHATSIVSMFTGNDSKDLGLCRNCKLVCIHFLDQEIMNNQMSLERLDERLARAIQMALARNVSVIQLSLEFSPYRLFAQTRRAIWMAARRGIRVVVSTGNGGRLGQNHLLEVPGVVPVAMLDEANLPHPRNDLGLVTGTHGLLAPGANIPVAVPPEGHVAGTGSSYASSFVTAAFALLCSTYRKQTKDEIWNALLYQNYERRALLSVVPPLLDIRNAAKALTRQAGTIKCGHSKLGYPFV